MNQNTNQALARWLSQGDHAFELALQHCRFEPTKEGSHLKIYCPSRLCEVLLHRVTALDWRISRALLQSLDIYSIKDGSETHECSILADTPPRAILQEGVDILGLKLLSKMGVHFDQPLAIVEMGTNRGVFCSKGILEQSRANDIDKWIDTDMARYHYPEGLATLEKAYESGYASSVEWVAKTFDMQPLHIAANVYAGELNGIPVRVTENIHWQVIG